MISEEQIARINALYHKARTEGLTPEEAQEQKALRRAYIDAVKGNLKSHLDHVHVLHPDGSMKHPDGTWTDAQGNVIEGQKNPPDGSKTDAAESAMDQRKAFRTRMRLVRAQMPEKLRKRKSVDICRTLDEMIDHVPLETPILAYAAIEPEVSLWPLLDHLLSKQRAVYLPVTDAEEIRFYRYTGKEDLQTGALHILEPRQEESAAFTGEEGLVLVPGVAFDKQGNRMGYGRGYYDRFLEAHPTLITIGVAFPEQMVSLVPHDDHDVPMQSVITGE